MLTVAASSGHWRHSAAVTDGGGEADMRDGISACATRSSCDMIVNSTQKNQSEALASASI